MIAIEFISIFPFLIVGAILVIASLVYTIKISNVAMGTLGYPVYFSMLACEVILRRTLGKDVYILNKSDNHDKLFFDNMIAGCTSMIFLISMSGFYEALMGGVLFDIAHIYVKIYLFSAFLGLTAFSYLCYRHQQYNNDKRDSFLKIQSISVKNFWKIQKT